MKSPSPSAIYYDIGAMIAQNKTIVNEKMKEKFKRKCGYKMCFYFLSLSLFAVLIKTVRSSFDISFVNV